MAMAIAIAIPLTIAIAPILAHVLQGGILSGSAAAPLTEIFRN